MFKTLSLIIPIAFILTGCNNEAKVKKDDAAACNSEAIMVTYKHLQDKYSEATAPLDRAMIEGQYNGLVGDRCQTFTKGMTVTVLETKETTDKLSVTLIETPDKKTFWMFSSDLE